MPILVQCGACQLARNAPDNAAGQKVKCPRCSTLATVPQIARMAVTTKPEVAMVSPAPNMKQLLPRDSMPTSPQPEPLIPSPITADWKRRIERELEDGEQILWAGQPDMTMATVRPLPMIASVLATLFVFEVLLWIVNQGENSRGNFVWLVEIGLLVVALIALPVVIFWHRHRAKRTCYALTNRRALVFVPDLLGNLNVRSYLPEQLDRLKFERSWFFGFDAGDLVFRKRVTTKTTIYASQGRVETSRRVQLYGFLMLRDARGVERLLVEHILTPWRQAWIDNRPTY